MGTMLPYPGKFARSTGSHRMKHERETGHYQREDRLDEGRLLRCPWKQSEQ